MYILHSLLLIGAVMFMTQGCATSPVAETCTYELEPDPSGKSEWKVRCRPEVAHDIHLNDGEQLNEN